MWRFVAAFPTFRRNVLPSTSKVQAPWSLEVEGSKFFHKTSRTTYIATKRHIPEEWNRWSPAAKASKRAGRYCIMQPACGQSTDQLPSRIRMADKRFIFNRKVARPPISMQYDDYLAKHYMPYIAHSLREHYFRSSRAIVFSAWSFFCRLNLQKLRNGTIL